MNVQIQFKPDRTYKTKERAVEEANKFTLPEGQGVLRYFIGQTENGRFFPVFVGEKALQSGVHFTHSVIG